MCITGLSAQNTDLQLPLYTLTPAENPDDNRFNAFIFQDSKKLTWIGSMSGVYRYDGLKMKLYKTDGKTTDDNVQSDFFEDNATNIWFSVYQGIVCYDRRRDSLFTYKVYDETGAPLEINYRIIHLEAATGTMYLRAGTFLCSFNIHDKKSRILTATASQQYGVRTDTAGKVTEILTLPTREAVDMELHKITSAETPPQSSFFPVSADVGDAFPGEGREWILRDRQQILSFDPSREIKQKVLFSKPGYEFIDADVPSAGVLPVTVKDRGLLLLDLKNKQPDGGLSSNEFPTTYKEYLHLTGDSMVWLSEPNQGLQYGRLRPRMFHRMFSEVLNGDFSVQSLAVNKDYAVAAIEKNLLLLKDKATGENLRLSTEGVVHQVKIYRGKIFVITTEGVLLFDEKKKALTAVANRTAGNAFYGLIPLKNGRILLSSYSGMSEIFRADNGKYYIDACPEFSDISNFVFNFGIETTDRKLYLPHESTDLWIYDTDKNLRDKKILKTGRTLFSLTESEQEKGVLLAGTDKGVLKIIGDSLLLPVTDVENRLSGKAVYGIAEDAAGTLWPGTDKGLFEYNPQTGLARQYEEIDGLCDNKFALYESCAKDENGSIYMGTNGGALHFRPAEVRPYSVPPGIFVSSLLLNDAEQVVNAAGLAELTLDYAQNTLLFDIRAVGYYKPERTKITYRLIGYEETPVTIDNGQQIRYAKLPPGRYTLTAQATDDNGKRSPEYRLDLSITPPYYLTWWFFLLALAFVALLFYGFYLNRVAKIKKEEERKSAMAELKFQASDNEMKALRAQMNPHFLFNSMNSIRALILEEDNLNASEYLSKFSTLLRSILKNSELNLVLLSEETKTLELYLELESLRFADDFKFRIDIDPSIDTDFVRIPPLIMQPFVENAVWHGLLPKKNADKLLHISIVRREDFLICEIEDNGVGRDYKFADKQTTTEHTSMGIDITRKRLESLYPENRMEIIDLRDDRGRALGTKVLLTLFAPE